ncbi:hypothetical protein HAX54_003196 [Datura stramonium]|uniref:Uncharacterized protein n=1 Tax=Datura stramonium TaxID=4076 RepID=A0ABS8T4Z7_DATST|nr:hypothetical protein [Datura stramonium]
MTLEKGKTESFNEGSCRRWSEGKDDCQWCFCVLETMIGSLLREGRRKKTGDLNFGKRKNPKKGKRPLYPWISEPGWRARMYQFIHKKEVYCQHLSEPTKPIRRLAQDRPKTQAKLASKRREELELKNDCSDDLGGWKFNSDVAKNANSRGERGRLTSRRAEATKATSSDPPQPILAARCPPSARKDLGGKNCLTLVPAASNEVSVNLASPIALQLTKERSKGGQNYIGRLERVNGVIGDASMVFQGTITARGDTKVTKWAEEKFFKFGKVLGVSVDGKEDRIIELLLEIEQESKGGVWEGAGDMLRKVSLSLAPDQKILLLDRDLTDSWYLLRGRR